MTSRDGYYFYLSERKRCAAIRISGLRFVHRSRVAENNGEPRAFVLGRNALVDESPFGNRLSALKIISSP